MNEGVPGTPTHRCPRCRAPLDASAAACAYCGAPAGAPPIDGRNPADTYALEEPAAYESHTGAAPAAPPPPAEGGPVPITWPVACRRCGYQLMGLSSDGVCPECAWPVARSLLEPMVAENGPDFVRCLLTGASRIFWGTLAAAVLNLAGSVLGIAVAVTTIAASRQGPAAVGGLEIFSGLVGLCTAAAYGVVAWGWWMLTEPEPSRLRDVPGAALRPWVRWLSLSAAAASAFSSLLTIALYGSSAGAVVSGAVAAWAMLVSLLSLVVLIAAFFTQVLFLKALAPRIPSPAAAQWASVLIWLVPVLVTVGSCFIVGPLIATALQLVMYHALRTGLGQALAAARATPPPGPDA
ncbi:MAG: zinc ribbon domain-containing protein [Phycisphaerales bacterium]|nr:zinc ribbon domain-containing protein [Phycisphaerales bacterium]